MATKNSFPLKLELKLELVVLVGIVASLIIAALMGKAIDPEDESYKTTMINGKIKHVKAKDKKTDEMLLAEDILDDIGYVKRVSTAKAFEGVKLEELLTKANFPIPDKTIKTEEVKNKDGQVVGTKYFKKSGMVSIVIMSNGKTFSTQEVMEKDGKYEGDSKIVYANGDVETLSYKDGKKHGKDTYKFSNGDKEIYNYVDGVVTGDVTYIYSDGTKETYPYEPEEEKK